MYAYLESLPEYELLLWSTGLSNACRDLVLDNGPYGLVADSGAFTGDADKRAGKYLDSYENLVQIVVYNPIEYREDGDAAGNKQEAYEEYVALLELDGHEALFAEETTHVGLECGCHATEEEFCCFMYATDAVDGSAAKPMDVLVVDQDTCEDSIGWSDNLIGEEYEDEDDGIEEVTYDVATLPKGEDGKPILPTYEDLSYEIYHHYTRLCEDA